MGYSCIKTFTRFFFFVKLHTVVRLLTSGSGFGEVRLGSLIPDHPQGICRAFSYRRQCFTKIALIQLYEGVRAR